MVLNEAQGPLLGNNQPWQEAWESVLHGVTVHPVGQNLGIPADLSNSVDLMETAVGPGDNYLEDTRI